MPSSLRSAVYRCPLLVEKTLEGSPAIYHSPLNRSKNKNKKPYFIAWPDIGADPNQPCCLPTLMRATYFPAMGSLVEPEKAYAITKEYISRPGIITPEIYQQVLSIVESLQTLSKSAVEIDALSPVEKYDKNYQPLSDSLNLWIDFLNFFRTIVAGGHVDQLWEAAIQGVIYGDLKNYPGAKSVFSYSHEGGIMLQEFHTAELC